MNAQTKLYFLVVFLEFTHSSVLLYFNETLTNHFPLITIRPNRPIRLQPGAPLKLICQVESDVPTKVTWFAENGPVGESVYSENDINTTVNVLSILKVFKSENYFCESQADSGNHLLNTSVTVTGPGSPVVNITGEIENCTVLLKWQPPLIPNGNITEYVVYYTYGNFRKDLRTWTTLKTNESKISLADANFGETYYFRILPYNQDGPGIMSNVFTLKTEPPEVTIPTVEIVEGNLVKVIAGSNVILTCILNADQPMTLEWSANGNKLLGSKRTKKLQMSIKGIHNSELFVCESSAENRIVANASVLVQVEAYLDPPLDIKYKNEGSNFIFTWKEPTTNGKKTHGYTVFYTTEPDSLLKEWDAEMVLNQTKIIVKNLSNNSTYYFKIRAFNDNGPGTFSDIFIIKTGIAQDSLPVIRIEPHGGIIKSSPLSTVNITCFASGANTILFWKKGNKTLLYSKIDATHPKGLLLKLDKVVESATYECHARNSFGSKTTSVHLIVQDIPGNAVETVEFGVEDTEVHLTWREPKITNGHITSYVIYYTHNPGLPISEWDSLEVKSEGRESNATIRNLSPDSKYFIKIVPVSQFGKGHLSSTFFVQTNEIVLQPEYSGILTEAVIKDFKCDTSAGIVETSWSFSNRFTDVIDYFVIYHSLDPNANITSWSMVYVAKNSIEDGIFYSVKIGDILPGVNYFRLKAFDDETKEDIFTGLCAVSISAAIQPKLAIQPAGTMEVPRGGGVELKCITSDDKQRRFMWRVNNNWTAESPQLENTIIIIDLLEPTSVECLINTESGNVFSDSTFLIPTDVWSEVCQPNLTLIQNLIAFSWQTDNSSVDYDFVPLLETWQTLPIDDSQFISLIYTKNSSIYLVRNEFINQAKRERILCHPHYLNISPKNVTFIEDGPTFPKSLSTNISTERPNVTSFNKTLAEIDSHEESSKEPDSPPASPFPQQCLFVENAIDVAFLLDASENMKEQYRVLAIQAIVFMVENIFHVNEDNVKIAFIQYNTIVEAVVNFNDLQTAENVAAKIRSAGRLYGNSSTEKVLRYAKNVFTSQARMHALPVAFLFTNGRSSVNLALIEEDFTKSGINVVSMALMSTTEYAGIDSSALDAETLSVFVADDFATLTFQMVGQMCLLVENNFPSGSMSMSHAVREPFHLQVTVPEYSPEIINITKIGRRVIVHWEIPQLEIPTEDWDYVIYFTDNTNSVKSDWDFVMVSNFLTEIEISDLAPEKSYTFCMRAKNDYGFGPWSDCISTDPDVGNANDTISEIANVSSTSVQNVTMDSGQNVTVCEEENDETTSLSTQSETPTSSRSDVQKDPTTVEANDQLTKVLPQVKKEGNGPTISSLSTEIVSLELDRKNDILFQLRFPSGSDQAPKYSPQIMNVTKTGEYAIVKWQISENENALEGWDYVIYYSIDASLPKYDWHFVIAPEFTTEVTISDLNPNLVYTFCMRTRNDFDLGPWSECLSSEDYGQSTIVPTVQQTSTSLTITKKPRTTKRPKKVKTVKSFTKKSTTTPTPTVESFRSTIPPKELTLVNQCNCTCVVVINIKQIPCFYDDEIEMEISLSDNSIYSLSQDCFSSSKDKKSPNGKRCVSGGDQSGCHCLIAADQPMCPDGYRFHIGRCRDINECAYKNGGCTHGCVNTNGGHYCACPLDMVINPGDWRTCLHQSPSVLKQNL